MVVGVDLQCCGDSDDAWEEKRRFVEVRAIRRLLEQAWDARRPHAVIVAGDFNDWRNHAHDLLVERMGLTEVFTGDAGRPVRSFPASLPFFRLDRIYVRGFAVASTEVHFGRPWSRISDHAALTTRLTAPGGCA